jgi:preprotein translocase subunit SecA
VDIILGGAIPDRPPEMSNDKFQMSNEYKEWEKRHSKVIKAGGLYVIGTERHEARRVDNQLRGRSGRQGDPGESRFYLSLEDDLMRIFGGEQIASVMDRLKLPEDQPIENALVTKVIAQSQDKVEGFHFDQRKRLVEYDDVANQQREIVYKLRRRILESKDVKEEVLEKLNKQLENVIGITWPEYEPKADYEKLVIGFSELIPFDDLSRERIKNQISKVKDKERLRETLEKIVHDTHSAREKQVGEEVMRQIERHAYLTTIDHLWIDYIDRIDSLRESVMLRAYGQRDPLIEFKNEAFTSFEDLLEKIDSELTKRVFRMQVVSQGTGIPLSQARTNVDASDSTGLVDTSADMTAATGEKAFAGQPTSTDHSSQITKRKLGRNDPCWCGSGNKFKRCHYPQLSS